MGERGQLGSGLMVEPLSTDIMGVVSGHNDPFEITQTFRSSRETLEAAAMPYFWRVLWDGVAANRNNLDESGRPIKTPIALLLPSRAPNPARGETAENTMSLPPPMVGLDAEGRLLPGQDVGVLAKSAGVYARVYAKAWIKNSFPGLILPLGNLPDKYRWLTGLWYLSNKGIEKHSTIKEGNTPRARLIVPYWDAVKVEANRIAREQARAQGTPEDQLPYYGGDMGLVTWSPTGNLSNPGIPTYTITVPNDATRILEEKPMPRILGRASTWKSRSHDPTYVNVLPPDVPSSVVQFSEITDFKDYDLMLNFVGDMNRPVTAWDVAKLLLQPRDLADWGQTWNNMPANDPIPGQVTQYHLPPNPDIDAYRQAIVRVFVTERSDPKVMSTFGLGRDPNLIRKLTSELAFIINTLRSP